MRCAGLGQRICLLVRPACAHSYGCKSRRELVTASEAQLHEGDRMWGGSVYRNCVPMNKNRIEGVSDQSERQSEAIFCKKLVRRDARGCSQRKRFANLSADRYGNFRCSYLWRLERRDFLSARTDNSSSIASLGIIRVDVKS